MRLVWGGAHLVGGIHVHPLLHEAGEGGEVALLRRLKKILLRLRAQSSALSASQEQGGEARTRAEASRGAGSGSRPAVWLPWARHRGGAGAETWPQPYTACAWGMAIILGGCLLRRGLAAWAHRRCEPRACGLGLRLRIGIV